MPPAENNETRKLQFTGRSTFIISLPKKWMAEMQLRVGDPVTIIRGMNSSLSVFPNIMRTSVTEECTCKVSGKEGANTVKRKVISMYLRGYNIIHIKPEGERFLPKQRDAVREVVNRNLIGAEIIEDSSGLITVTILMGIAAGLSMNTALRRMFLIGVSMHRDAITALCSDDKELAMNAIRADDEVDRFSLYLLRNLVIASQHERLLYEIGLKKPTDCFAYRAAGKSLERIADHGSRIAYECQHTDMNLPNEILLKIKEMSEMSLKLVDNSIAAFLQGDYYAADKITDQVQSIASFENDILAMLNKFQDYDSTSVPLILAEIRRTAEHGADIAEAALNQSVNAITEPA